MEIKTSFRDELDKMVGELETLNKSVNSGKGFDHVTSLIEHLKQGHTEDAKIEIETSSFDKFGSIPKIKDWLVENLYQDDRHPWELTSDFYKRLSQKRTILIDTRAGKNQETVRGVENKLIEDGYVPHYPPLPLTATRFSSLAKFDTVDLKRPDEALDEVLTKARLTTNKNWWGKVVVRIFDQGQKDALVFLKPRKN